MLSAEQQKTASRKLTHWLENDKKIVTFRELSREIGCHVNAAKNLLLDYYEAHSSVAPTYLLTGNLLSTSTLATTTLAEDRQQITATQRVKIVDMDEMSDGDRNSEDGEDADGDGQMDTDKVWGNDHGDEDGIAGRGNNMGIARESEVIEPEEVKRWGVVLVQGDNLDEKKALFDQETLNIHIYALSPRPVKDPAQYLVPNLALRSHASYYNPDLYGTITGVPLRSVEENSAKPMKDGAMDFSTGKKESKVDAKPVKEEKKDGPKVKDAPQQPEPAKPKAAPKPPAVSKPSQSKSKKRIITSDDEEDRPGLAPASNTKLEATSSQVRAADAAAIEAMMGMDMDVDIPDEINPGPAESKAGSSKVKQEENGGKEKSKSGVKRKRKVKRTVTVEDAKGYMVSTDHWSEVETSGSEEEAPQKTTTIAAEKAANTGNSSRASSASIDRSNDKKPGAPRHPPNKPAAANARKSGQSTLQGFFKKK